MEELQKHHCKFSNLHCRLSFIVCDAYILPLSYLCACANGQFWGTFTPIRNNVKWTEKDSMLNSDKRQDIKTSDSWRTSPSDQILRRLRLILGRSPISLSEQMDVTKHLKPINQIPLQWNDVQVFYSESRQSKIRQIQRVSQQLNCPCYRKRSELKPLSTLDKL